MKAIVLQRSLDSKIQLLDLPKPVCDPTEVLIRIKAAALNHRDEWCRKGLYPNLQDGVVLGSDGAGIVEEVGAEVNPKLIGQEVMLNPALHWGNNDKVQGKNFEIIGMPRNGTFAEYVVVPADRIHPKPSHLSWEEAAALPLAGLTAYRALVIQGKVQVGEQVLVTGIGGGVAQFAAQFALALGAKLFVSSSSLEKREAALAFGATDAFDYSLDQWSTAALESFGGMDLIVDGAAGETLSQLMNIANPGARLVFYGATRGNPPQLEARKLFWNQLQLIGTTMGTDQDFADMLALVDRLQLKPRIDAQFSLAEAEKALDRMKLGVQFGKIVLIP
ncbi:MAG: zinc-binding dehydrogenase [Bacteroidetes bacterium]|nr:zinc-binding dehydrogenase [Bacteroidota bacterium]MDA1268742.1 zinc-binding dehydrogenase [Bacteroidota bacterium]